ncbi:MAG: type IX secretion system membrane protein PorP/SprF [Bacteroidales bacterium]|jgi:type IX secretion system PorP/SprF family membrane protein|nr:type IX secretion system membrane protein PorP/SprF [Bacteroidales bacterium]
MKQRTTIILAFALVLQSVVSAQQAPITSQYLTNGLVINPSYAGTRGALSANLSYRKQWARIVGAPQFQNISLHSPINQKEKVALGISADYVTFGVTKDVGIYGYYAYSVRLSKGRLSMGLRGGVDLSSTNYNNLKFPDGTPPDPLLTGNVRYTMPNVGAGVYYYTDRFFAGLSVPSIFKYQSDEEDQFTVSRNYDMFTTYFSTGVLIRFTDGFKLKPSTLIRYSMAEPLEVDINANLIFADILWIGGSYRIAEQAAVALLDIQVTPQLKLGYSFDYQLGHLNKYTNGTHEVTLRYEFEFSVTATSPRYF